ncbi:MAG: hypothetical protein ACRDPD_20225 [Streptosporangiaceae bacterium]
MAGALPRRVRHAIKTRLGRSLTVGAVQYVLADPGLLLMIDGVSEVDADAHAALSADLQQLRAERPVRLVATGRDLPLTIAGPPGTSAVFRLCGLDHVGRGLLAAGHGGPDQAVLMIGHRLTADNPMLFLMALVDGLTS